MDVIGSDVHHITSSGVFPVDYNPSGSQTLQPSSLTGLTSEHLSSPCVVNARDLTQGLSGMVHVPQGLSGMVHVPINTSTDINIPRASSTPDTTKEPIPDTRLSVVDTGWAWVVAAAACFCLFFTCGFSYSTGVYYVVFLETFGASKAKTAWISSLNFGILCAVGPMSSLLINRISCRFSVFLGGIMSSTGLLLSAFAGNIHILYITFGILTGAGFGLVFTPCVVIISEYFIKYRLIAMGLSVSGTGLGTIVYPWLSHLLIRIYGWRGALILSAGINAHVCVAALVMRPNRQQKKFTVTKKKLPLSVSQISLLSLNNDSEVIETCSGQSTSAATTPPGGRSNNSHNLLLSAASLQSQQDIRKDNNNNHNNKTTNTTCHNRSIQSSLEGQRPNISTIRKVIHHLDLDIFTKPTFLLLSVNTFLFCFGMSVMYTHISSYAASVGLVVVDQDSLVSAIGLTNLIGRVVLSLAAHCLPINATWLFIGSYLLAGCGTVCCAVFTSFTGLLLCVCIFGFFSAGFGPLLSEVTCLAVGVKKFSMAYGHLMVFMAVGTMIGAPIAGMLYDTTQYYQASFYLAGACLILSSAVMLLDVLPSRCRSQKHKSAEEQTAYIDKESAAPPQ